MIKYFCDKCGQEIDTLAWGILFNTKHLSSGEEQEEGEFVNNHFCKKCIDGIRNFIKKIEECELPEGEKKEEAKEPHGQGKHYRSIDIGKILALKDAKWSVEKISEEMNLTPQQIHQAIYLNKKKAEKEAKVIMQPCQRKERPKI